MAALLGNSTLSCGSFANNMLTQIHNIAKNHKNIIYGLIMVGISQQSALLRYSAALVAYIFIPLKLLFFGLCFVCASTAY